LWWICLKQCVLSKRLLRARADQISLSCGGRGGGRVSFGGDICVMTTAFVTGGASGIGLAAAVALVRREACAGVTVADVVDAPTAEAAVSSALKGVDAALLEKVLVVTCDCADPRSLRSALAAHEDRWNAWPSVLLLNAGVEGPGALDTDEDPGPALAVNLVAVVHGVREGVPRMRSARGGTVVITASAAGLYPSPGMEVYAAAKAGAVHFARSLAWMDDGSNAAVRVYAACPQFADTALVRRMQSQKPDLASAVLGAQGDVLTAQQVADGILELVDGRHPAGTALRITVKRGADRFRFGGGGITMAAGVPSSSAATRNNSRRDPGLAAWALGGHMTCLPASFKRVEVVKLGTDFGAVTQVTQRSIPKLRPGEALVRTAFAGVNASDVNYSAGKYHRSMREAEAALPFAAGFESVGVIAAVGDSEGEAGLGPGSTVAVLGFGGFSEFQVVKLRQCLPVPGPPTRQAVALLTSGLTASIALEVCGRLRLGDTTPRQGRPRTVVVTAAAGGTGQFALQLAKRAGCRVVAVCSAEKESLCRSLGADTTVDYRKFAGDSKALGKAMAEACGKGGADVVYESVGGHVFEATERCLAPGGRLIIIGMMSQYTAGAEGQWTPSALPAGISERLLAKGAALEGFFLPMHAKHFARHFAALAAMLQDGSLTVHVDPHPLGVGVQHAAHAVARLQGGKSIGKVCLQVATDIPNQAKL